MAHRFVLILDEELIAGHLFGSLKLEVMPGEWIIVERRCRLCNRLPIELITIDGGIALQCEGASLR